MYDHLNEASFAWVGEPLGFTLFKFRQWLSVQDEVKNPTVQIIDIKKVVTFSNIKLVPTSKNLAGDVPSKEIACINIYTGKITKFKSVKEAGRTMGVYYKSLIRASAKRTVIVNHRWFFTTGV